jgi:cell division protein FtsW (lipid II flippase)
MINSALERQAESTDELMCGLIEERDRKNLLILVLILAWLISLKPIQKQLAHRWVALQCQTHQPSR